MSAYPSSAYATLIPLFNYDSVKGFYGGAFWDGRATGWTLGNAAADQAQGPPLNPLEQALKNKKDMVQRVCTAPYSGKFKKEWNDSVCDDTSYTFDKIAFSIGRFEASPEVNKFNSKFDRVQENKASFTKIELQGFDLFKGNARCIQCHTISSENDSPALFTNYTYQNIGIPRNPENPFYHMDTVNVNDSAVNPDGKNWIDPGVGGFLQQLATTDDWRNSPFVPRSIKQMTKAQLKELSLANHGKHRVPTLRNVDQRPSASFVKAYTHNGFFKDLKSVVHYYNTRDVLARCTSSVTANQALASGCWPSPEVPSNLNKSDLGNLGLSSQEEDAIVAFLKTLSDSL